MRGEETKEGERDKGGGEGQRRTKKGERGQRRGRGAAPDPGICYGGGGGGSPLTAGGGGGGGGGRSCLRRGGGAVGKLNEPIRHSHARILYLKHKEHHDKRVHSAPALSCSTASLTFVRTTE